MKFSPFQPSAHENQMAMAILAHAARRDDYFLTESLHLLADSPLDPICVIAAMLTEFQSGMDLQEADPIAEWFADQALAAAEETGR